MNKPIVCITGATSGFGLAMARRFASEGYRVILTGRRTDRLTRAAEELRNAGAECLPLSFDVRNRADVEKAFASIPSDWLPVDVLINNAGLAVGRETIEEGDPDDWDRMIDTNVKGLLWVSRMFIPGMKTARKGTIINIGSIAGREGYPGGNVYSATKFAVDALNRSMRIDLLPFGIRVGQIAPGAAETEFSLVRFKGDQVRANAVYEGFEPLHPEDIADAAWYMASRPPHVCIQDMLIMPTAQAGASHLYKK